MTLPKCHGCKCNILLDYCPNEKALAVAIEALENIMSGNEVIGNWVRDQCAESLAQIAGMGGTEMIHHGMSGHIEGLDKECNICAPKIINSLKNELFECDKYAKGQYKAYDAKIDRLEAELHDHKIGWGMAQKEIGIQKSKAEKLADALRHSHSMHHALLGKKCTGACIAKEALVEFEKGV